MPDRRTRNILILCVAILGTLPPAASMGKGSGHGPQRQKGVPFPFPELMPLTVPGRNRTGGGARGNVAGENAVVVYPALFWKYRVPLHDKRILARKPLVYFIHYLGSVVRTGRGTP